MQFTSFFPFLCLAARSFQEAAHRRQRRHHRRRCECRCCGCAGRDPAQGPADAAAAAAAEREGRGDPEALSFPSLLSLSPFPPFPSSLLSFSPFPLSFPSLPPSPLSFFSPFLLSLFSRAMGQLGCQLATGIAANGGKGGGKGGLLWAMWVWVGLGAIQAPHKKRRAATSGIAGPPRPTQLAAKKFWYQYNSQY